MPERVRSAVKVGVEQTEIREFPFPAIASNEGLLRVEAVGVGGAEPEIYRDEKWTPIIMGHQTVGVVAQLGPIAAAQWKVSVGERIVVQEYLPCKACRWCARGDYRLCPEADFFGGKSPRRLGLMNCTEPPHLFGGFSEYLHMPWNTVIHRIPQDLPAHVATLAIPIGNGVQWTCLDGDAGPGKTVLVIGPGQQGLGCVIAAKMAGATCIILSGLTRDRARLDLALKLGADFVINAEEEDLVGRVTQIVGADGVDVVVDTTGDPGGELMAQYLRFAAKGAYLGVNCFDQGVPVQEIKKKFLTVRSPRGRTYGAVDLALKYITSGKFPLEEMCSHRFGLDDVDLAIKATAGKLVDGAIHVVVEPSR
jgi:threonine dehydrogenase-like Zn-dependent dehydrogenase